MNLSTLRVIKAATPKASGPTHFPAEAQLIRPTNARGSKRALSTNLLSLPAAPNANAPTKSIVGPTHFPAEAQHISPTKARGSKRALSVHLIKLPAAPKPSAGGKGLVLPTCFWQEDHDLGHRKLAVDHVPTNTVRSSREATCRSPRPLCPTPPARARIGKATMNLSGVDCRHKDIGHEPTSILAIPNARHQCVGHATQIVQPADYLGDSIAVIHLSPTKPIDATRKPSVRLLGLPADSRERVN